MSSLAQEHMKQRESHIWLPLPIPKRAKDRNTAKAPRHPDRTEKLGWWDAANSSPSSFSPAPPCPLHCSSKLLQRSKAGEGHSLLQEKGGTSTKAVQFLAKELPAQIRNI